MIKAAFVFLLLSPLVSLYSYSVEQTAKTNYKIANRYNRYRQMVVNKKTYLCNICGYTTHRRYNLKRHRKIHSGEKPYNCNVCNKRFREKHHLKAHSRIHSGEKPFKCKSCNRPFSDRSNQKRHEKTHSSSNIKIEQASIEISYPFLFNKKVVREDPYNLVLKHHVFWTNFLIGHESYEHGLYMIFREELEYFSRDERLSIQERAYLNYLMARDNSRIENENQ